MSAPRVAKVCDFFTADDSLRAYLVMEYMTPTPILAPDLPQRAARALQWLRGLPAPEDAKIGPLGDGRARHMVFQDYEVPLSFSSIEALERYTNLALQWIPPRCRPDPISISHESVVFTQADMDASNFFVDTKGNTCLIDFEDVGLLPVFEPPLRHRGHQVLGLAALFQHQVDEQNWWNLVYDRRPNFWSSKFLTYNPASSKYSSNELILQFH